VRCQQVRKKLAEYQLGGLEADDREAIAAHLRECADCARELEALGRLDDLFTPIDQVSAPDDLWERVQPRLRPRRVPWWKTLAVRPRPAIAAAAAIVMAVLSVWLWSRPSAPPEQQVETLASALQEQQIVAEWSSPLADDAALGVVFASLNGDVWEQ